MRVLLRFIFEQMNINKVKLNVFSFNQRALRMYQKCGFKEEGRLRQELFRDGEYHDIILMGLLREEYQIHRGGSFMPKIAFMGAGSTVFAKNILGDCLLTESLRESEFALFDIDLERLVNRRRCCGTLTRILAAMAGSSLIRTEKRPSGEPIMW